MCNLSGYIKCYDTLKGKYVKVPVSAEVEIYIKRSRWREDIQNRRYIQRITDYGELVIKEDLEQEDTLEQEIIKKLQIEYLKQQIEKLEIRDKSIIMMIYYKELTLTGVAKKLGISTSYTSRLVKKINRILKASLENINMEDN
ncbi:MAG: DUF1492 domain-containing protein [Lachnospiraceae bacterium]|jgi:RNA polymerase sigma factor (sigma-70 family)|nr:DUF1492 domain-containing protein [Lachnospiraceae bacterium]